MRRAIVIRDRGEAVRHLRRRSAPAIANAGLSVAFLFPGQGAQHPRMGSDLYEGEPLFRDTIDRCAELLAPDLGLDLRTVLYPGLHSRADSEDAAARLRETRFAQPALFAVEYALAQLWMDWGLRPAALLGHSVGEYVAACLAGVFPLPDALRLMAARGRLMQELAPGAMLAVELPAAEVAGLASAAGLDLAAVNAPDLTVVSGPTAAVEALAGDLRGRGVECRPLHTSHAFHSAMTEPVLERFRELVAGVALAPPALPYLSNLTGDWVTSEQATDPGYWAAHLRHPVLFADGVERLLALPDLALLEVGPGRTLSALVRRQRAATARVIVASLRRPGEAGSGQAAALTALGQLWQAGAAADFGRFWAGERRRRVPLPTYPFERRHYWVESRAAAPRETPHDGIFLPVWRQTSPAAAGSRLQQPSDRRWLLLADGEQLAGRLAARLERGGAEVFTVTSGPGLAQSGERAWSVDPLDRADWAALLARLAEAGGVPSRIACLWGLERGPASAAADLLRLVQALSGGRPASPSTLTVVTRGLQTIAGETEPPVEGAALLAVCGAIPGELPGWVCRNVDLPPAAPAARGEERLLDLLAAELAGGAPASPAQMTPIPSVVALRGRGRWVQTLEPAAGAIAPLREGGRYLVAGGLDDVTFALAHHLVVTSRACLAVMVPAGFPPREEWAGPSLNGTGEQVRRLEILAAAAGDLLLVQADPLDEADLRGAVAHARGGLGGLDAVIRGTASTGARLASLTALDPEAWAGMVQEAVGEIAALDAALEGEDLELRLLAMPLTVGSAAAVAAIDAWTHRRNETSPQPWLRLKVSGNGAGRLSPELAARALHRLLAGVPDLEVVAAGEDAGTAGPAPAEPAQLPASRPGHDRPSLSTPYMAPRNAIEQRIEAIWCELLGLSSVGVDDDLFELGGHSLLATRIMARVREATGVELSLGDLFADPTVAGMAARVAVSDSSAAGPIPRLPRPSEDGLPLSPAQERLWFLFQLEPHNPGYNLPFVVRLRGDLDIAALTASFAGIVRRHEALRTRFALEGGLSVQVVEARLDVALPVVDLAGLPAEERERQARALAGAQVIQPFDLTRLPLFRFNLLRLAPEEWVLAVTLHHIAADAWSFGVIARELSVLYPALLRRSVAELPELPIQYADYAAWQRQRLADGTLAAQITYWRRQLSGAPRALLLPTDGPRPHHPGFRGGVARADVSAETAAALKQLGQAREATLFMTLLALFDVVLHHYSGQLDFLVGSPIAGRTRAETEPLVGFFINTLVLRADLAGDPSFEELLDRVRRTALEAFDHQDVPLQELTAALDDDPVGAGTAQGPLFRVWFVLQNTPERELHLPGVGLGSLAFDQGAVRHDLNLALVETADGFSAFLEYRADLFAPATAGEMVWLVTVLAEEVAARPAARLSELVRSLERQAESRRSAAVQTSKRTSLDKLRRLQRSAAS